MKTAKYLWMDLEMTGLDPDVDKIIEMAAIVTDADLNELATQEAVVKIDESFMRERMVGEFWEEFAQSRDNLIAQNGSGQAAGIVENGLLKLIADNFEDNQPVYLAGNSIWNDRQFIIREWKNLDRRLHYRMLDVTAWKLVFKERFKKDFIKPKSHRALDDIRGSIEELQYYLKYMDTK